MDKIMYTNNEGLLCIVIPTPKDQIEKELGRPLSDQEYEDYIWQLSIPDGAINPRSIKDEHIPPSREFRNAWCDLTPEPIVDFDFLKAKDIQLTRLRSKRDSLLDKYDKLMAKAVDMNDSVEQGILRTKKQELRDATEQLKDLSPKSIEEIKDATPDMDKY
jgi:hypothetical protein